MEAVILLGQIQAAQGATDRAIASYQLSLQQNPRNVRLYVLMGQIEDSRGNWQKAQEAYQKALAIQPDYPVAASKLAPIMLDHGGNVDLALSLAQTARRGLPDSPETADALAWAYYYKGVYKLAANLLEEAVKKVPANATYQYHLGLIYHKMQNMPQAKMHLQRALQLEAGPERAAEIRKVLAEMPTA
jgi:tetratricopeptide (TPR) repeat protein